MEAGLSELQCLIVFFQLRVGGSEHAIDFETLQSMGEVFQGHAKQGQCAFPQVLPWSLEDAEKQAANSRAGGNAMEHQGGICAQRGAEDDVVAHQSLGHQAFFPEAFNFLRDFLCDVFRALNEPYFHVCGVFIDEQERRCHEREHVAEFAIRLRMASAEP